MAEFKKNIVLSGTTREEIRREIITEFLKEKPGTKDETSVYYYIVEKTQNGVEIYLKRPARLNKGMDFEVHAVNTIFENMNNKGQIRRSSKPSHSTIIRDLDTKKRENPLEYKKIFSILERIFNCTEVSDSEIMSLNFKTGYPVELIIKIIKWLFIEQDITYWNWSGRNMFYSAIKEL